MVDVTSFYSDVCGGIRTYYQEKARHLPGLGVECHFVVPGSRRSEEAFGEGVMHRLPGPPLPGNRHYRLFGPGAGLGELLRRLAPDVIEVGSHTVLPLLVRRALRGWGPRRPRVLGFFHSDHVRALVQPVVRRAGHALAERIGEAVWAWDRRQHAHYDLTLAASRVVERDLVARGYPRVRWVGLGVDTGVFQPAAADSPGAVRARAAHAGGGPPTLVYAGRLSPDKEVGLLLGSIDRIHRATGAVLRVLGEGPSRAALARFAASRPYMTVEGLVSERARLASALASADAVLVPFSAETFSLGTAEALACGTPVVCADTGASAELVRESGAGLHFRAGDPASLADAVIRLLARPGRERRALGEGGRAFIASRYTWPAVLQRLLAAYRGQPANLEALAA